MFCESQLLHNSEQRACLGNRVSLTSDHFFSPAVTLNWRVVVWERRSATTTASKASRGLSLSPTDSLMASGTRLPSRSAHPTYCCTSTVTGNTHTHGTHETTWYLCHKGLWWFIFTVLFWSDTSNELSVFIKVNICSLLFQCGWQIVNSADNETSKDKLIHVDAQCKRKAVALYSLEDVCSAETVPWWSWSNNNILT